MVNNFLRSLVSTGRAQATIMTAPRPPVPRRRYSDRKEVRDDFSHDVSALKRFVEMNGHFSLVR